MLNKDFLKQILADKKRLLKLSEVKLITVPHYHELSVKALYPHMIEDAEFRLYFPDKMPQNHLPDRTYFFNILNTIRHEFLQRAI